MKINITIHGEGFPLVFFHGWGYDSLIWHHLIPFLSTHYQLYLVDLPGFGASDLLDWDDFKTVLLKQLPMRFAVVGWSLGGLFATRLSIEAPGRVTHLCNVASSPCFIQDTNWPGSERLVFQTFYANLIANPAKSLNDFMGLQWQGFHTPSKIPLLDSLTAGLDVLLTWDLRSDLHNLIIPVSFLFGRLDRVIPRQVMTAMQATFPHFEYKLIEKAAHAPFLSHQALFLDILTRFLTQ